MVENKTNSKKDIAIIILFLIIAIMAVIITLFYSGILKGKTVDNNAQKENIVDVDKLTDVKRLIITETNQEANIGDKVYRIRREITVDGAFLYVDDVLIELENSETAYAEIAYVTNKYIIFTVAAQDWESIVYVMDKDGKAIAFESNDYQIHDLKVNDGILCASGHVFCGVDGNCPDKDLVIKYENNSITISPKN